jgi:hypothetical protein
MFAAHTSVAVARSSLKYLSTTTSVNQPFGKEMNRLLLISVLLLSTTHAQWSTDPTQNLIVGYGANPELCSDGAGGCYVTYENSIGYPTQLVLERINRYGYKAWPNPRFIAGELEDQRFARITEDGYGGVIIAYQDDEFFQIGGIWRIHVQRVDSSGNLLWGPTGVRASVSETPQDQHAVVSDGQGGCIVAWIDTLGDLRINRIDAPGNRVWGDSGKYIWNSPAIPLMVSDGRRGCIMVFGASRCQRIDQSGIPLWGPSGIQLENVGGSKIISDGFAGAVFTGMKFISYNNGDPLWAAKAQRIDSLGQILWGNNGVMLEDSLHGLFLNPPGMDLENNLDGGATLAWGRRTMPGVLDLRTQTVRSDGSTILPLSGRRISTVSSRKGLFGITPSDSSTNIFVWWDQRPGGGTYAQRLDTTGNACWDTNDVAVSLPGSTTARVTTDCSGGFIIVENLGGDFSIRAQQVNRYGNLGQVITSLEEKSGHYFPQLPILYQNYPNPFNPQTIIRFQLPRAAYMDLTLYNILGQNVRTLASGVREAGLHSIILEARDLPSGIYLYQLTTPQALLTHKLIIIK